MASYRRNDALRLTIMEMRDDAHMSYAAIAAELKITVGRVAQYIYQERRAIVPTRVPLEFRSEYAENFKEGGREAAELHLRRAIEARDEMEDIPPIYITTTNEQLFDRPLKIKVELEFEYREDKVELTVGAAQRKLEKALLKHIRDNNKRM